MSVPIALAPFFGINKDGGKKSFRKNICACAHVSACAEVIKNYRLPGVGLVALSILLHSVTAL